MATYQDYQIALQTLALKNKLDRFGNNLVTAENIQWAKDIIKEFFKLVHKYAKKMTGHYWCRLKLAWLSLKRAALKKAKTVHLAEGVTGKRLKMGKIEAVKHFKDFCNIKVRTAKSYKRIRAERQRQPNRLNRWDIFNII